MSTPGWGKAMEAVIGIGFGVLAIIALVVAVVSQALQPLGIVGSMVGSALAVYGVAVFLSGWPSREGWRWRTMLGAAIGSGVGTYISQSAGTPEASFLGAFVTFVLAGVLMLAFSLIGSK